MSILELQPAPGFVLRVVATSVGFTEEEGRRIANPQISLSSTDLIRARTALEESFLKLADGNCEGSA